MPGLAASSKRRAAEARTETEGRGRSGTNGERQTSGPGISIAAGADVEPVDIPGRRRLSPRQGYISSRTDRHFEPSCPCAHHDPLPLLLVTPMLGANDGIARGWRVMWRCAPRGLSWHEAGCDGQALSPSSFGRGRQRERPTRDDGCLAQRRYWQRASVLLAGLPLYSAEWCRGNLPVSLMGGDRPDAHCTGA